MRSTGRNPAYRRKFHRPLRQSLCRLSAGDKIARLLISYRSRSTVIGRVLLARSLYYTRPICGFSESCGTYSAVSIRYRFIRIQRRYVYIERVTPGKRQFCRSRCVRASIGHRDRHAYLSASYESNKWRAKAGSRYIEIVYGIRSSSITSAFTNCDAVGTGAVVPRIGFSRNRIDARAVIVRAVTRRSIQGNHLIDSSPTINRAH